MHGNKLLSFEPSMYMYGCRGPGQSDVTLGFLFIVTEGCRLLLK